MWRTTPAVLSTKVLPRMFRCPPATNSAIVRWGNLVPCGLGPFAVERLASVFDGCEGKANAVAPMNRPATGSVIPAVPGAPDTRQARLASAGRESALSAALRPRCVRPRKLFAIVVASSGIIALPAVPAPAGRRRARRCRPSPGRSGRSSGSSLTLAAHDRRR